MNNHQNMNLKGSIHSFGDESRHLIFHSETFALMQVSESFGTLLELLEKGKSDHTITTELDIDLAQLKKAKIALAQQINHLEQNAVTTESPQSTKPLTLYLNVSNACNLRCVYCYANFGNYTESKSNMSSNTMLSAVDRFYADHGQVGTIVFFGGEPLLQPNMIVQGCDYALDKAKALKVKAPHFSMVTNGTLLSQANVDILAKYAFSLTVSIDGPAIINDILRPTAGHLGSYSKITQGLERLKAVGIIPNIESTYTAKHIEMKISPTDLLKFFRAQFSIRTLTIAPVASTPGSDVSIQTYYDLLIPAYRDATRFSLESMTSDRPIMLFQAVQILRHLIPKQKKPNNQFCYTNLGKDVFAVSADGHIYPCQMFNDKAEFKMGDVHNNNLSQDPQFKKVQDQFAKQRRDEMQCKTCWARHMCFICLAGVEIETGQLKPIPKHRCDLVKGVIEEVMLHTTRLMDKPDQWTQFIRNVFK